MASADFVNFAIPRLGPRGGGGLSRASRGGVRGALRIRRVLRLAYLVAVPAA